jgi:DNA-binding NarL/FixJ family response regulator
MRTTISLLHDGATVPASLAFLLTPNHEIECTGAYADLGVALEKIREIPPQVVLIDIGTPPIPAFERITKEFSQYAFVIVLSVCDDLSAMQTALSAGASGYILKPANSNLLRQAIVFAGLGGIPISAGMKDRLTQVSLGSGQADIPCLSNREQEVASLIAHGLSDKAIAEKLGLSQNTIKAIKRGLFAKWAVHSRSEVVLRWMTGNRKPDSPAD